MNAFDEPVRALLRRVRRRWLWSECALALARAAVIAALAMALGVLTVRLAGLAGAALIVVGVAVVVLALAGTIAVALPLRRRPSDARVARFVEECAPEFRDALVSAVDLRTRSDEGPLAALLLRDASDQAAALDVDRVVSMERLRGRSIRLAAALAALVVVVAFSRAEVWTWWRTTLLRLFPPTLTLVVEPGDATVLEGDPLVVSARIEGRPPELRLEGFELRVSRGRSARSIEMKGSGDTFRAEIARVREPMTYRVLGPLTSGEYRVVVNRRPRVARVDVGYTYPRFSGLAPRIDEDSGDVYAPAGTRVRILVHTADPVAAGALAFAEGRQLPLAITGPTSLEAEFTIGHDGAYRVGLTDVRGISTRGDTEYFVRVMSDRPPDVRLVRPGGDQKVTRLEEVVLEARADDDYGVDRLELVYAANGGRERVVPLHAGAPAPTVSGTHTMYVENLDVQPGDFVTVYARARDIGRGKRATEARSDIFFLEVRPFNQEFEAAQSMAMSASGGSTLDLAAQQKEIVVATWKLERRSAAGRSTEDVRAVARAQAEIRTRAERLVSRGPLRRIVRPGQTGQPPPGAGTPNAMQDAVEAMGKAVKELEALNTRSAIPHEMTALNALLKAEAEIQRRQIARQQANAGGRGGQTGNQDLSALFDRELQRQLQNNYENRSTAEERSQEQGSEALEKLRELAQRQDELARRQQELARQQARLQPEDVKRQLERLTREQEEVRRSLEQLSQQMGRQGQGAGTSATRQDGNADDQRLSGALDDMRRAVRDLEQSDPAAAGGRSARALEQLRSAARRLERPSPGDGQQAAGDLGLEARELAEAERRVANDLGKEGQGTAAPDSLRRLGGEQSRLADRAERLEQQVRELSGRDGTSADAARQAVQELGRGDLAQRLRESADALHQAGRDGGPIDPTEAAASADRAAQMLERAADALARGAGRDGESKRLSEELARTRALRDRLGDTERRIEQLARGEAHARGAGSERPDASSESQASRNGQRGRGTTEGTQGTGETADASQPDVRSAGENGRAGSSPEATGASGQPNGTHGGGGGTDAGLGQEMTRLQQQYARDAREARQLADAIRRADPELARRLSSPKQWEPSLSAPGTEAFKQDYARWDLLRRDVRLALEALEASLSARLNEQARRERLDGGPDDRTPDQYRRRIAKYYESLARQPR